MKTRALIVDDEQLARGRLRKMLSKEPDIEVVGECSNGPAAIASIRESEPDVVFLDVQMPEVDGFEVLRALPAERMPAVIFVTAHDRHAVEAFEVQAADYLLKPFTQARLQQALKQARQKTQNPLPSSIDSIMDALKAAAPQSRFLDRVLVRNGNQSIFVKVEEIDFIESAANYVVLRTRNGSHILRETLSNLESRLPPRLFLRISRSNIVNLERVKGLQVGQQGENVVVLDDGRQLVLTRPTRELQHRLQFGGADWNSESD